MTPPGKITVKKNNQGERLDIVIAGKKSFSRSQAQKLIATGRVLVNGQPPKKTGDKVKTGDKIIVLGEARRLLKSKVNGSSVAPLSRNDKRTQPLEPKVVAETPDYLILDKPSGLLVHPTQANETGTLAAWLIKNYPEVKKVGDDPETRPGIVHRLDKEVSGLLAVARTRKMFEHLKNQFKNRTVEKEYLALAHGKIAKDWDTITFPLARGKNKDRMAARPAPRDERGMLENEKEARTEFFVEKRFVNFTLLRVIIHTGRMHQIRAHLLAYNHPTVGDRLYYQKKRKRTWDERCGRLFLHSTKLGFTDLNGEKQTFESPLPEKLENFLKTLS